MMVARGLADAVMAWDKPQTPPRPGRIETMLQPIAVHTEEDYQRAQERVEELNAEPDSKAKESELAALAEAMLAFEMRRDEAGN